MKTQLKLELEQAIDKVIQENCEDLTSDGAFFVHDTLADQMANAAEQVFDAAMEAQAYAEKGGGE